MAHVAAASKQTDTAYLNSMRSLEDLISLGSALNLDFHPSPSERLLNFTLSGTLPCLNYPKCIRKVPKSSASWCSKTKPATPVFQAITASHSNLFESLDKLSTVCKAFMGTFYLTTADEVVESPNEVTFSVNALRQVGIIPECVSEEDILACFRPGYVLVSILRVNSAESRLALRQSLTQGMMQNSVVSLVSNGHLTFESRLWPDDPDAVLALQDARKSFIRLGYLGQVRLMSPINIAKPQFLLSLRCQSRTVSLVTLNLRTLGVEGASGLCLHMVRLETMQCANDVLKLNPLGGSLVRQRASVGNLLTATLTLPTPGDFALYLTSENELDLVDISLTCFIRTDYLLDYRSATLQGQN